MGIAVGGWGHNCCIFGQNSKGMTIFGQHLEKNGNWLNDILCTHKEYVNFFIPIYIIRTEASSDARMT